MNNSNRQSAYRKNDLRLSLSYDVAKVEKKGRTKKELAKGKANTKG
jgi:hypothetical protein